MADPTPFHRAQAPIARIGSVWKPATAFVRVFTGFAGQRGWIATGLVRGGGLCSTASACCC